MKRKTFLQLTALCLVLLPGILHADDDSGDGAVFTMNNSTSGNSVLAFQRANDGTLTPDGEFPTGGLGTGGGLGNQGSVLLAEKGRWLLVCNAGSDEISVFAVKKHGLVLRDKVSSEGRRPISLTLDDELLYVLNAGGAVGDADNISAFRFKSGKLSPIAGSTRALSAANTGPAQVSFAHDGDVLVVTEKATGIIDTFTVGDDGLAYDHKMFLSPVPTPFGFAVSRRDRIFVSEANGGAADASAVSSYRVSDDGDLSIVSGSVATMESAACWVVLTRNERYTYASNTGSDTITGYRVSHGGNLETLDGDGITATTGSKPIDLALSRDSRYLYSLNSGDGTVSVFRIKSDGSLQARPGLAGIPAGANGLAAE